MLVTKFTLAVLCFVLLFAIYVANMMNLMAIDHNFYTKNEYRGYNFTQHLLTKYNTTSNSDENILWFLQISDIHISIFRDYSRVTDFRRFCQNTVRTIKPSVVLATGDLTDAKEKNNMGSRQYVQEWEYYHDTLRETGMQNVTTWLDIRGNHDDFNVVNIFSKENYYKNYSIQGNLHPRSYVHTVKKGDMTVAFLGVDACPEPGPKRPFNFIGLLDTTEINTLDTLQKRLSAQVDHTIWFGHYPTSCILWLNETSTDHKSLRQLIGSTPSSMAYLCGHLHTLSGLVPNMYTIQKGGFLEIELSDWKDNRFFRLGAIDNGLFSFIDQKHGKWPLILVTNPKNARYAMPGREPLSLMFTFRQIRILVFSDADITLVEASIDGKGWTHCTSKKAPIYKCDWDPTNYLQGLHTIFVHVKDTNGRDSTEKHPFALDDTKIKFDFGPRFLLMLNATTFFQTTFATFLLLCILPLIIFRLQKRALTNERKFMARLHRKLWLMANIDSLFYPLVLYAMYLPLGPWSVGELIDGHIGVVFAWGIIVNGVFLPGSFTYAFGSMQLGLVQLPLTLILAHTIENRIHGGRSAGIRKYIKHLPFILLLTIQMLLAYFFWLSYGTMAFLFGPLRTWSVLLSLVLWYKAVTLPYDYGRKLMKLTPAF